LCGADNPVAIGDGQDRCDEITRFQIMQAVPRSRVSRVLRAQTWPDPVGSRVGANRPARLFQVRRHLGACSAMRLFLSIRLVMKYFHNLLEDMNRRAGQRGATRLAGAPSVHAQQHVRFLQARRRDPANV